MTIITKDSDLKRETSTRVSIHGYVSFSSICRAHVRTIFQKNNYDICLCSHNFVRMFKLVQSKHTQEPGQLFVISKLEYLGYFTSQIFYQNSFTKISFGGVTTLVNKVS